MDGNGFRVIARDPFFIWVHKMGGYLRAGAESRHKGDCESDKVFLLGAAAGHILSMRAGNFAPDNAGVIFYTDVLGPLAMLLLFLVLARAEGRRNR